MSESTGILDKSSSHVIVLTDDKITLRGNVTIHGVLDVGLVKTTEIISDSRYEKKFLTFAPPVGGQTGGTGLLWLDSAQNRQLVYQVNPERFFLSEHVDIPGDKAYLIDGSPILTWEELGSTVTKSNLRQIGTLKSLKVGGDVNLGEFVFYDDKSNRFSIGRQNSSSLFSIYDVVQDVEIVIEGSETGAAKIGSFNNKNVELVTGNHTRVTIGVDGNIILGNEYKEDSNVNLYGKLGINVKNPQEDLEVAGNIKFQNKLFATGTGIPESGYWQKGDIVWNAEPGVSKYIGWVCTEGGNPGFWAPFGLIVN